MEKTQLRINVLIGVAFLLSFALVFGESDNGDATEQGEDTTFSEGCSGGELVTSSLNVGEFSRETKGGSILVTPGKIEMGASGLQDWKGPTASRTFATALDDFSVSVSVTMDVSKDNIGQNKRALIALADSQGKSMGIMSGEDRGTLWKYQVCSSGCSPSGGSRQNKDKVTFEIKKEGNTLSVSSDGQIIWDKKSPLQDLKSIRLVQAGNLGPPFFEVTFEDLEVASACTSESGSGCPDCGPLRAHCYGIEVEYEVRGSMGCTCKVERVLGCRLGGGGELFTCPDEWSEYPPLPLDLDGDQTVELCGDKTFCEHDSECPGSQKCFNSCFGDQCPVRGLCSDESPVVHGSCPAVSGWSLDSSAVELEHGPAGYPLLLNLNGDGAPDLAVVGYTGQVVTSYVNQQGSFSKVKNSNSPYFDYPIAVGKGSFNGDPYGDVFVLSQTERTVSYLIGGPGGLRPQGQVRIGGRGGLYNLVMADFNNDGLTDFIVNNQNIFVYYNNGHGLFDLAATLTGGIINTVAGAGDVDGDGFADIVRFDGAPHQRKFTYFRNDGAGGFVSSRSYNLQGGNYGVVNGDVPQLVDMDGDGFNDLITIGGSGITSNVAAIYKGDGNGLFTPMHSVSLPNMGGSRRLYTVDMNGDCLLDIVGRGGVSGPISVIINKGSGSFADVAAFRD